MRPMDLDGLVLLGAPGTRAVVDLTDAPASGPGPGHWRNLERMILEILVVLRLRVRLRDVVFAAEWEGGELVRVRWELQVRTWTPANAFGVAGEVPTRTGKMNARTVGQHIRVWWYEANNWT